MKEVRWTETSIKSLKATSEFILELWDEEINEAFLDHLDFRISQIQSNPDLGLPIEGSAFRKLIIHKTVSLFYINKTSYIKILLIWDNRSDPKKVFKHLLDSNS